MGKTQIESKLEVELKKRIKSELQIVYILSRIRKLLEIENLKSKYPVLNFYCNWSLHSEITKTDGKKINTILKEFIERPEKRYILSLHYQFRKELTNFLKDKELPVLSDSQLNNFNFQLGKVISDTPIEVMIGTRYRIIFKEPQNSQESGLSITSVVE